jgi:hypothetical protein
MLAEKASIMLNTRELSHVSQKNIRMLMDCAVRYGSYTGRNTHAEKVSSP